MPQRTSPYFLAGLLTLALLGPAVAQQDPAGSPRPSDHSVVVPTRPPERPSGVKPMTLKETLNLGLTQNPLIRSSLENVEQARASYQQQKTQKHPKLILDNTTTLQPERSINTRPLLSAINAPSGFPEKFVLNSPVTDQFRLSLQVLLTTFGRVENEIAASFLQIDVQLAEFDVDRLNLAYQLKQAFFDKLSADATVEVSRLNLSVANQNLDDTKALFEQGVMSRYDGPKSDRCGHSQRQPGQRAGRTALFRAARTPSTAVCGSGCGASVPGELRA